MEIALRRLRAEAVRHTLFTAPDLAQALALLPFVQADPIRSPARAQDLILRQRVEGYRVGDLERSYPELDLEEGYLYAYGFLPRLVWQVRHPANTSRLGALEKKVLARVNELGLTHPEALRAELGRGRSVNAWGGHSTRVKLALESLHSRGLVRVAERRKGVRLYAPCPPLEARLTPREVFALIARTVVRVLAPAPERTVRSIVTRLSRRIAGVSKPARELEALVADGTLERQVVSGLSYLWLANESRRVDAAAEGSERRVRFLAPFDPLVWDRLRFEQLWGWSYRFEAYTPAAKRVRGYYAMPLCRGDDVIGWANVEGKAGQLDVELGFVGSRPKARDFKLEVEREVERLRAFLLPRKGTLLDADDEADDAEMNTVAQRGRPRSQGALDSGRTGRRAAALGATTPSATELRATAEPGSSRPRAGRRSRRPPS
ncbi:MAG TPA: crosslink repair DNA glycosylase YcaQ family protein [Polyangiaceae bacterium]|nr:crosslink repair DNA glycosylase YcaQ family protein [Polyangiaceae bacterium]